ncbi:MAG: 4Fe-4S binding protein [Methanomassiliicoccaceae archaeon]|jgi:pyruvate ferredoxin oxidoreductase delta subunit|nr:4Fe-4S binding protein [Methanomassiliicoccaceae archaeon]
MPLVPGGRVIEPGSALKFETGDWRSFRPVLDRDLCIDCMTCWVYCPDDSVLVDVRIGKMTGFRMTHCKGCGICSKVCPKKAITMAQE